MADKVTKNRVNHYSKIIFTQPLKDGRNLQQIYEKISGSGKAEGAWRVTHVTNSEYSLCSVDGTFRECEGCKKFSENICKGKKKIINGYELANRCNDCISAGVPVEFI